MTLVLACKAGCLALLLGLVFGARVQESVMDGENATTSLKEGDVCDGYSDCGGAGVCAKCGSKTGSQVSVCCRESSKSEPCPTARAQMAQISGKTWKNPGYRECVTLVDEWMFKVFRADEVDQGHLPLIPKDHKNTKGWEHYHDNMKGILWMDQTGAYGFAEVGAGSPDAAVTFGDPDYKLDVEKTSDGERKQDVGDRRSFTWFNSPAGYKSVSGSKGSGFYYRFYWAENFRSTRIQIRMKNMPAWVARTALSADMVLNDNYASPECNQDLMEMNAWKKKNSMVQGLEGEALEIEYKKYISECAKWDRRTSVAGALTSGYKQDGYLHYPAFEIVDKDGKRREPYWSKYVEWSEQNCAPDADDAIAKGVISSKILEPGTTIVATRNDILH